MKKIKRIFLRPKTNLRKIMVELRQLRQELQLIKKMEDPLEAIIVFFNAVSKWHDRGIKDLIQRFEKAGLCENLENLKNLQNSFEKAGRDKYGFNRTEEGEMVTEKNVFLGDIYGLYTKPISFWKERKNNEKGGWGYPSMENLNAYDVISRQAKFFLARNIEPIISTINEMEEKL